MENESLYKLIISYISLALNVLCFFLFFFNKRRDKGNSKLQTAFMINFILHSILNYLSLVQLNDGFFTIKWSASLAQYIYPYLNEEFDKLYEVNIYVIFPVIAVVLSFEIFICLELVQIVKNPIKSQSFRMKLFIFFLILYLLAMIIYIFHSLEEIETNDLTTIIILLFFHITYPSLIIVAVWSILIIVIVHSTASLMFSNRKLKFLIMHCCSIWFVILVLAYPFYLSLKNSLLDSQSEAMIVTNICFAVLNCFRLTEMQIMKKRKTKPIQNKKRTTELSSASPDALLPEEDSKEGSGSGSDLKIQRLNRDSTLIDISVLAQNNFLYECFVYLIQGILHIATIETGKAPQYNINPVQCLQSRNHKYQIESKIIKNIITSEPRRRRFWGKFLKQFKIFTKKVHLIEYAPEIFKNIRSFYKIDEQQLKISFDLEKNLNSFSNFQESEGKSGSLFFFTYDHKYIFKTISERERKTLTHNFLQSYYELLAENNSTSLSRIYGAYVLNIGMIKINFILMENISPFSLDTPLYKFDLKGSEVGRSTKRILQNTNKTLKDLDYSVLVFKQQAATININDMDIPRIKENLIADLNFLEKAHLMDYSLFLAITDNTKDIIKHLNNNSDHTKRYFISQDRKYIYLFGIIDYLTKYDKWKNLENKYLRIRYFTGDQRFSAIEPSSYRMRFYNYLVSNVFLTSKQRDLKTWNNRVN